MAQIENLLNQITQIPVISSGLAAVQQAVTAANTAAQQASTAATNANTAAAAAASTTKLVNSYISPSSVLSSTTTMITVVAHTRYYADGTSVSVNGGTVSATTMGDTDYVSYNDPSFMGGSVTYVVSTTNPAQTNGVHVVGAILIPTTGTATGGRGPSRPGTVQP